MRRRSAAQFFARARLSAAYPSAVLSIGKLSAGQAERWAGSGAAQLGLSGPVDGDDLRHVLGGLDPYDGTPLRSSSSTVRVAGFDLTFSAPKSVGVVFGIVIQRFGRRSGMCTTTPSPRRSATCSAPRRRSAEATAEPGSSRREAWSPLRSGTAPHGRATRSCTRTFSSPTSVAPGRPLVGAGGPPALRTCPRGELARFRTRPSVYSTPSRTLGPPDRGPLWWAAICRARLVTSSSRMTRQA
jgi:hypothetical protein